MLLAPGASDAEIARAAMWVSDGDPAEIPEDYQLEEVPDLWGKVNGVVSSMLVSSTSELKPYAVSVQNTDGREGTISVATFANCLNVLNYVLPEGGLRTPPCIPPVFPIPRKLKPPSITSTIPARSPHRRG